MTDIALVTDGAGRASVATMNLPKSNAIPDACKVYTPPNLAGALVCALKEGSEQTWLEPSYGHGVFLNALASEGVSSNRITAIEIDVAAQSIDGVANCIRGVDALEWMSRTTCKFDVVVGNPPYVALSEVQDPVLSAALNWSLLGSDERVSKNANLWLAFAYAAIGVLSNGGALGLVLPAAFEFATYAAPLRRKLPHLFNAVHIIRSKKSLFENVQEGCVVLLCTGFGGSSKDILRSECTDLDDVVAELGRTQRRVTRPKARIALNGPRLGDLGAIRIGAVSGDAKYFLLRESQRRALQLPEESLVRVLSKSRHLHDGPVNANRWRTLWAQDEPIWLFRPIGKALKSAAVRRYLEIGEAGKCNLRSYKIREREPWYQVPLPPRPDYFFSPSFHAGYLPAKNASRHLSFTNSLYGFYFSPDTSLVWKRELGVAFSSGKVQKQIASVARRYAAGLRKLEPSDLADISLPPLRSL